MKHEFEEWLEDLHELVGKGASMVRGYLKSRDKAVVERDIYKAVVLNSQEIMAEWIVPDSEISDKECLERLLGVLDNEKLVRQMGNK